MAEIKHNSRAGYSSVFQTYNKRTHLALEARCQISGAGLEFRSLSSNNHSMHIQATMLNHLSQMGPTTQRPHLDLGAMVESSPALSRKVVPKALEITEAYALQLEDRFAVGAHADIYKATMTRPGGIGRCQVAVKVLRCNGTMLSAEQYEQTLKRIDKRLGREMEVWKRLTHPRITPLLAYAKSSSQMLPGGGALLVSPYRENANLRAYLSKKPNADKLLLLKQVCEGLNYIHVFEPPIAHLDLKPENILINDSEEAELCGFGLSKTLEDVRTGNTTSTLGTSGTTVYMAPEALNGEARTTASDIYSMGGVILHVVSGVPPWGQTHPVKVIQHVLEGMAPPRKEHIISGYDQPVVEGIWVLMRRCWSFNPQDRPKAFVVLKSLTDLYKSGGATTHHPTYLGNSMQPSHREEVASDSLDGTKSALHSRSDGTAEHEDLSMITKRRREAVEHCSPSHPDRSLELHQLASALEARYDQDKNPNDLTAAIEHLQEAVNLRPPGHPKRDESLHELASALQSRYSLDENPNDLATAIGHFRETVALRPPGHPKRDELLHNLASALQSRYYQDRNPKDLSAAIEHFREAVDLRPPGHSGRDASLHDLATALKSRFALNNNSDDLLAAVDHFQEAFDPCPPSHRDHSLERRSLTSALRARYEMIGGHRRYTGNRLRPS